MHEATPEPTTDSLFTCFDKRNKLEVPFKTYSDAQIAHLLLRYALPWSGIQFVLKIVRDPHFHASEVSFNDAADIDLVVATHQKNLFQSAQEIAGNFKRAVPVLIVEQVADMLADDLDSLASCMVSRPYHSHDVVSYTEAIRKTLRQMSLVNRSWRSPAQRALLRRIVLQGDASYQGLTAQRMCLPLSSTREICSHMTSKTPSAISRLPVIFSRMPQIRGLDIRISSMTGFRILLEALPCLRSLEILRIGTYGNDPWPNHATGQTESSQTNHQGNFALPENHPHATLQTIIIRDMWEKTPLNVLSWLLRARGSFAPRKLVLQIAVFPLLAQAAGESTARTLEVLHAKGGYGSLPRPTLHKALQEFLRDCSVLKRLGIDILTVQENTSTVLTLPKTLESLNIVHLSDGEQSYTSPNYVSFAASKERLGSLLSSNISTMPRFRTLILPLIAQDTSDNFQGSSHVSLLEDKYIQKLKNEYRIDIQFRNSYWDIDG